MGPAVGLEVEPDDLDRPNLVNPFWQKVDLRPNEIGDRERLLAWQDIDSDVPLGSKLVVDSSLDVVDEIAAHPLELEVHPTSAELHVAARDEGAVVAPDDAAQGVEGGVRSHQDVPPCPVDVDGQDVVTRRRPIRRRLQ